jgi:hypothetical protein
MAGLDQYGDTYDGFVINTINLFIGPPIFVSNPPLTLFIEGQTPTGIVNLFMFSQYKEQTFDYINLVVYNPGSGEGMLGADNCVFYHPMKPDGIEHVYWQTWTASGISGINGATAGQVGMALSVSCGSGYAGWYSPLPIEYPHISGCEHVSIGFWSKNIGNNTTVVEIERDNLFTLSSGSISLGNIYWTDSETISLINNLGNGDPHFILCDFNYEGSNNWSLSVSLDGSGFISHGVQDSGTMGTDAAWSTPRIAITNVISGATTWLDEVIVWAGDSGFEAFSDVELFDVYRLGGWHYLPMWRYDTIPIFNKTTATIIGGHRTMANFWCPVNWDKRIK